VRDLPPLYQAVVSAIALNGQRSATLLSPGERALLKASLEPAFRRIIPTYSSDVDAIAELTKVVAGAELWQLSSWDLPRISSAASLLYSVTLNLSKWCSEVQASSQFKPDDRNVSEDLDDYAENHKEDVARIMEHFGQLAEAAGPQYFEQVRLFSFFFPFPLFLEVAD
jgi:hypothetical protein